MSPSRTLLSRLQAQYEPYADARILDPRYTHAGKPTLASTRAYVDNEGNIHDSDYQMFPTATSDLLAARRAKDKSRMIAAQRSRYSLDDSDSELESDEEDEYQFLAYSTATYRPSSRTSCSSPSSNVAALPSPAVSKSSLYPSTPAAVAAAQAKRARYYPSRTASSSSAPSSSPPNWQPLNIAAASPAPLCHYEDSRPSYELSSTGSSSDGWSLRRWSRSHGHGRQSVEVEPREEAHYILEEDEDEDIDTTRSPRRLLTKRPRIMSRDGLQPLAEAKSIDNQHDHVPSCSDSIKRRWDVMMLSVQLSTFRATRKLKQKAGLSEKGPT